VFGTLERLVYFRNSLFSPQPTSTRFLVIIDIIVDLSLRPFTHTIVLIMLGPLNVSLADFGVSTRNGFLPDQPPLRELSNSYYESWEIVLSQLPQLLKSASLRSHVDQLPVLSPKHLISEGEWQRAYMILSFFTHSYIWEAGGPSQVCTRALTRP